MTPAKIENGTSHYLATSSEAATLIKTQPRGTRFHLFARCDLPIQDTDKVFPGLTLISLTKADALKAAEDLLKHLEARGARLPVSTKTYPATAYSKPSHNLYIGG